MMDKKPWLLAILVIFGLVSCATIQSDKAGPPPTDINIIPPSPDLPKDIATFSGKWVGTWSELGAGRTEVILVIEEIHDTWAQILYSWADNPRRPAGYYRGRCKIISDHKPKIYRESKDGDLYFEVKDSNTLEGTLRGSSQGAPWTLITSLKRAN